MSILKLALKKSIYYEYIPGDVSRPTLVFLHEGLGCTAMWEGFARNLCQRCNCPGLIYDRQGYGQSSSLEKPRSINYLQEYAFDELSTVITAIIPDRPHILIGHSDGGSISLLYGSTRPSELKGIVTMAAHVFVEPVTLEGIKIATQAFAAGKLNGLYKYHGDKTDTLFRAWSDTWLAPWFTGWNIEACLPAISADTLVIQGIDDQYGTQQQVDAICSQVSGNTRPEMIENCGHAPHAEQPETVSSIISDFICK